VTGVGPGSFIGVRIAVSVAQGMAFAAGRRVVAASSLASVAAEAFAGGGVERVVVAQDAHRQEVYLARFALSPRGVPEPIGQPVLQGMTAIDALSGPEAGRWYAAGAGWRRHSELLDRNEGLLAGLLPIEYPRASFLLATGREAIRDGSTIDPDQLVPAYVRHQVAKLPWAGGTQAP
jgi:tRNA threonylcarbamoyladenosine biosynthesis protein TsaB